MKYLLLGVVLTACLSIPQSPLAWDGFDADTTDLVEITPDKLPRAGETIDVRNYDTDSSQTCLVEAVTRNARTVEVIVRSPDGHRRTLVMEGR